MASTRRLSGICRLYLQRSNTAWNWQAISGLFCLRLQPGETDVAAAKAAHEKVREELRTDEESKEAHKDTFLSGSYARSTAINDINDVDVICILDLDHRITEPEVCLAWIQGILARYYKETKRQGRSVGASAAKGVWLDIVPATLRCRQMTGHCGYLIARHANGFRHTRRDRLPQA